MLVIGEICCFGASVCISTDLVIPPMFGSGTAGTTSEILHWGLHVASPRLPVSAVQRELWVHWRMWRSR